MGFLSKVKKLSDITVSRIKESTIKKNPEEKKIEKNKRRRIIKELRNEVMESRIRRVEEIKKLNLLERLKRSYRDIPIITAVDDFLEGMSGIEKVEEYVRQNPDRPYAYLLLAETLRVHNKAFITIQSLRLPLDFFGSFMDISTEYIGNSIESIVDREKWTYIRALNQAANLGESKINPKFEDLISTGRAFYLLSLKIGYAKKKREYIDKAERYYIRAMERNNRLDLLGEILYYLSEVAWDKGNINEYKRCLNEARKVGFYPAAQELRDYYKNQVREFYGGRIGVPSGVKECRDFKYSFKFEPINAAISGTINTVEKQGKKILNTGEGIFDIFIDNFLKE